MPVESPDGKTLYYAHLLPEKGIWKMPVQGGEAVQVTGPVTDRSRVRRHRRGYLLRDSIGVSLTSP